ncbi:hypothetical protein HYH02_005808 [Chlamydomonas schloesseri]|uniref:Uncharacterized protein n=1 Tax=Chlamydomonas schloesseri TaxID=2026947 RepID=A0A835WKR3_9CHLO|nr:hypothetical protein HYH02_005808 [Chlamydomonas schloesseri]|eukprot:KAG2449059.1 hypothetical protein HYH02_005808 [Chlamydomonas schloesseri]
MQALSQHSVSTLQQCSSLRAKAGRRRCRPQSSRLITPTVSATLAAAESSSSESPCSTSSSSVAPSYGWPRGYFVRTQAAKGFGAGFGSKFKLPSLGGKGPKVPQGGVLPAPAVELEVPAAIASMWAAAQAEWLRYVVEHPVVLPGGAEVFLVPVGADLPGDAGLIQDVVAAVRPDAIALESQPQHLKSYTAMAKALEPQLSRLLAADLARSPADARAALGGTAAREDVQAQLLAACRGASVKPDPDQLTYLFRLGSLPFAEWVVPAHLVRTASASTTASASAASPLLLLSCGLDREARAAAPAVNPFLGREFDLYLEEVEAALGEEAGAEMDAWRAALGDKLEAAGAGRELATLLAAWEGQCCLGPAAQRRVAERVAERLAEEAGGGSAVTLEVVRTPADPLVAKRLVELAAGKDVVRPSRRIVAVVGRVHALSVEAELRALAGAGSGPAGSA